MKKIGILFLLLLFAIAAIVTLIIIGLYAPWSAGVIILLLALLIFTIGLANQKFFSVVKGSFSVEPSSNGVAQVNCAFGQVEHVIVEQPCSRVKSSVAFGQLILDFTKTTLKAGDTHLIISSAFASVKIIVPSDLNVRLSIHSAFGRVIDCRMGELGQSDKTLVVSGSNAFSEVEIISKSVDVEAHDDVQEEPLESVSVKHNNKVLIISLDELLYIQAEGDYVTLCTTEGNFLKEQTMKYFQTALPADKFVRIHRSYIVNLAEVSSVDNRGREVYFVTLKNGATLKVSSSGYQELKQRLGL